MPGSVTDVRARRTRRALDEIRIAVAWPKRDYLTALRRAGGSPKVLQADRDPLPAALNDCDGVMLTGGADVNPEHYGDDERHPALSIDSARDHYELALTKEAFARNLPILAICRGLQLLNVAAGGTLVQDIPTQFETSLIHRKPELKRSTTRLHHVQIKEGSRLADLLRPITDQSGQVVVNSRHHQAVRRVAPGFVVSATAPDGLVEAVERSGPGFCIGVQWHPENFWRTGEFRTLFEGLVTAARQRRNSRS
jgi:putative glutamine amidotransferase